MKKQGKNPEALQNMPRVPDGYGELLRHFRLLSGSRSYGFSGPNPIDFLSVFHYNQAIARLDLEFFLKVIQMLDEIYLNSIHKAESSDKKGLKGSSK